jgi:hypothetical protein
MGRITANQFRHLVSAMLFIDRHIHDKEKLVDQLRVQFAGQVSEPDPVIWIRNRFEGKHSYPDGVHIRKTFRARTYHEAQTSY